LLVEEEDLLVVLVQQPVVMADQVEAVQVVQHPIQHQKLQELALTSLVVAAVVEVVVTQSPETLMVQKVVMVFLLLNIVSKEKIYGTLCKA
jgi:hypothetical protein